MDNEQRALCERRGSIWKRKKVLLKNRIYDIAKCIMFDTY